MKKADFVKMLAEKMDCSQKQANEFINVFDSIVMEEIFAKETELRMPTIGTFKGVTKHFSARKGRNPQTGAVIEIPEKTIKGYGTFKASKAARS